MPLFYMLGAVFPINTVQGSLVNLDDIKKGFERNPLTIFLFFTVFIGAFIVLWLWNRRLIKKERLNRSSRRQELFKRFCEKYALTIKESAFLRDMLAKKGTDRLSLVFKSPTFYEDIVDDYLSSYRLDIDDILMAQLRRKLGYNQLPKKAAVTSTRQFPVGLRLTCKHSAIAEESFNAVVSVNDDASWMIEFAENAAGFSSGLSVYFEFIHEFDTKYRCAAQIKDANAEHRRLVLAHTRRLVAARQRKEFRLRLHYPVEMTVMKSGSKLAHGETVVDVNQKITARLEDISGGGICAFTRVYLPVDTLVQMDIVLPNYKIRGVEAEVVGVDKINVEGQTGWDCHLHFASINPVHREKIVRFVFNRQTSL